MAVVTEPRSDIHHNSTTLRRITVLAYTTEVDRLPEIVTLFSDIWAKFALSKVGSHVVLFGSE